MPRMPGQFQIEYTHKTLVSCSIIDVYEDSKCRIPDSCDLIYQRTKIMLIDAQQTQKTRHFININLSIQSPPSFSGGKPYGTSFHRALQEGSSPPGAL